MVLYVKEVFIQHIVSVLEAKQTKKRRVRKDAAASELTSQSPVQEWLRTLSTFLFTALRTGLGAVFPNPQREVLLTVSGSSFKRVTGDRPRTLA